MAKVARITFIVKHHDDAFEFNYSRHEPYIPGFPPCYCNPTVLRVNEDESVSVVTAGAGLVFDDDSLDTPKPTPAPLRPVADATSAAERARAAVARIKARAA